MVKRPSRKQPPKDEFEFEIFEAHELSPREAVCLLVGGPAKTGKSKFLSSMSIEGETLLIATLQREATSWGYQQTNPDVILLQDPEWRPSRQRFEAEAYLKLIALLEDLSNDDKYKVVLLDNGTQAGVYAWHEALKPFGVASPGEMEDRDNRFRPYTTMGDLMEQMFDALLALKTAPLPKHVGIAWHLQPTKDDQVVFDKAKQTHTKKVSADTKGEDVEYLGDVLPMLQGGFRRKIASLADGVVYTHLQLPQARAKRVTKGRRAKAASSDGQPRYMLQVLPDAERHAGIPGPMPPHKYIDNDWAVLRELLGDTEG